MVTWCIFPNRKVAASQAEAPPVHVTAHRGIPCRSADHFVNNGLFFETAMTAGDCFRERRLRIAKAPPALEGNVECVTGTMGGDFLTRTMDGDFLSS